MGMPDPKPFQKLGAHGNFELGPVKPLEVSIYPRWIEPHSDFVTATNDGRPIVVTHECHIDRESKKLTILVHNAEEEAKMSGGRDGLAFKLGAK